MEKQKENFGLLILRTIIGFVVVILLIVFLLLLLPFLLVSSIFGFIDDKKFVKNMNSEFIKSNEGKTFFVYTSRIGNETYIKENLLCFFSPDIELIVLKGKIPYSKFPEKYIRHILFKIDETGFPSILRIFNGKVYDVSLHNDFYNAKAHNLSGDVLNEMIKNAFIKLESKILTKL